MKKAKSEYAIQTVANALRVLEAFREEEEIGVAELSRRLGLHKNNVFRLLATLQEKGYIEQSPSTERYRLGIGCLELALSFSRSRNVLSRGRPIVNELARAVGETAHLAMLHDFEVVHVIAAAPRGRMLHAATRLGWRLPAHACALGRVLLGLRPESDWERFDREVVSGRALPGRTPRTVTDPAKFFEELRSVVAQGFAAEVDQCEPGLGCVAAPVYDADGTLVAAISVSVPTERVSEQALVAEIRPRAVAAAEELSRALGHTA